MSAHDEILVEHKSCVVQRLAHLSSLLIARVWFANCAHANSNSVHNKYWKLRNYATTRKKVLKI